MQRYRVNFPLLIGLVVGTIALVGGTIGLYQLQRARGADRLLSLAAEKKDEGDVVEAIRLLGQYLSIRKNDPQGMEDLANAYADLTEQPDVEPQEIQNALGLLEATVRDQPKNAVLRRRMVDLSMKYGLVKPALDHISQLLNMTPRDAELEGMKSDCLFGLADPKAVDHAFTLIGYDPKEKTFDAEKAIAPKNVAAYRRVAGILRGERNQQEEGDAIINQMVEANPNDGKAYLLRAQYLEIIGKKDEAKADLAKALEMDATDPQIAGANAQLAVEDKDFDRARALVEAAIKANPDDPASYQTLAYIEGRVASAAIAESNSPTGTSLEVFDSVLAAYDRGLKAVAAEKAQMLYFSKARLQIERNDREGAKKTIAVMRETGRIAKPLLDYLSARLMVAENRWYDAATEFEKIKGYMANVPEINPELNFLLGLCYEKLGQNERALSAYRVAQQAQSSNAMATYAITRVEAALGQSAEGADGVSIYDALGRELAKPESQQDWVGFQRVIDAYAEKLNIGDAMKMVLEGEVLMRRKMYEEAREKLRGSYKKDPNNLGVRRAAVKLFASDPEQGPAKALKLLDKVVDDFGDLPILRLERADLLAQINDENLRDQLFDLTKNMEDWKPEEQVQVWSGLAGKFEALRDREATAECLAKVVELTPGDLQTVMQMFMSARESDDDAGMKEAQDRVLKIVKSRENENWLFCEAHRLVSRFRTQMSDQTALDRASERVKLALGKRPEWHQLHLLKAEIALLRNDAAAALESFDRAAELGRPTALSLYQHVKLLVGQGRYQDAIRELEKVNGNVRTQLLGQEYADALLAVGRTNDALAAADRVEELAAKNEQVQLWLGQFRSRASTRVEGGSELQKKLIAQAGEAFQNAVEINPQLAEGWLSLVGYHVATKNALEAENAVRAAQLALVEDQTQLMFARCYELLGRAMDAESAYLKAYEASTGAERARSGRLLAQYYLGPGYPREDKVARATPIINELLRQTAEGKVPAGDENARWARSTAARLLAMSGEYRKLLDAERLLSSNVTNGQLPADDRLLMAEILAPRPEPVSRLKAAQLLEGLQQGAALPAKNELDLAKLYFALGDWRKCREQMVSLTAKFPKDPAIRVAYLRMLLERGGPTEIDAAVRQLKQLVELAPNVLETRELAARVALKRGKRTEAVAALRGMLPRDLQSLKAEQLPLVSRVAQLLAEVEDYQGAEALLKLAADRGTIDNKLEYSDFIGRKVDAQRGFESLTELKGSAPAPRIVQIGLSILRAREAEGLDPKWGELVHSWVDAGLREDPDSIPLKLERAELLDVQARYDEAAKEYRALLGLEELQGISRAVVLNNLAYLLAMSKEDEASMSEARRYCDEAVSILGPQSDILDTRAVIAISAERYDDAIADMKLAVIDTPTASKHFHKALAHLGAGQNEEAAASWEQAQQLGLAREDLPPMERPRFDKAKAQLEGLGLRSAQL